MHWLQWIEVWCLNLFLSMKTNVVSFTSADMERSGSVVECLTRDQRAVGWSLTSITVLCP